MNDRVTTRAENWTTYWSTGALHSCAGSFEGNYAGGIGAFWRKVFNGLPPQARVLDLCCGNGPLSKMLLEQKPADHSFSVDAVDLARVMMPWLSELTDLQRSQLRVHPGVDVASLPFPDDHFSLCISQYGIEYAGTAAFSEAARVLRPGGKFAAVIHNVNGIPVEIARFERQHIAVLLSADGLYATAAELIEPMSRSGTEAGRIQLKQNPSAARARLRFNAALSRLQANIQAASYPDVFHEQVEVVLQVLNQVPSIGAEEGRRRLGRLQQALASSLERLDEVVEHASDETCIRAWMRILGDHAPVVEPLLFDNGTLAGWGVSATHGHPTHAQGSA